MPLSLLLDGSHTFQGLMMTKKFIEEAGDSDNMTIPMLFEWVIEPHKLE